MQERFRDDLGLHVDKAGVWRKSSIPGEVEEGVEGRKVGCSGHLGVAERAESQLLKKQGAELVAELAELNGECGQGAERACARRRNRVCTRAAGAKEEGVRGFERDGGRFGSA
jgi:hypothetical protein